MEKEEYEKRYNFLPSSLKEALEDETLMDKVSKIAEDFSIEEESLAKFVGEVFLGIVELSALKEKIKEIFSLPEEKIESLGKELNENIFLPYKEEIEKFYQQFLQKEAKREEKELSKAKVEEKEIVGEKKEKTFLSEKEDEEELLRKKYLLKKGPDKYREPIDEKDMERKNPVIIRKEGRIQKLF